MSNGAIQAQGTKFEIESATSGTFVEIGGVKSWSGFDGESSDIDVTNLKSTAKESRTGLQDFGKLALTGQIIYGDVGQSRCRALRASAAVGNMKVTYSDGTVATFSVNVKSVPESGGVDGVVEGSINFKITGNVTIVTS
ncbi:MAG: hypothetical protein H6R01_940 [Burkholderiaceae bacterium]|nr:hypothetical protein [Burkholderiaceae bacterium]